ncbi:MAG: RNA polymerase sigma factor [Verrucomicrobiales bacterium]|nr:RNA polymerase sigma factor [Verrucomicrobiales bacterium]
MPSPDNSKATQSGKTDSRSLPEIFAAEETPILRYAFSLVGRRAVAEEIVQDSFLQLHTHWDEVENPVAWLYRAVRNRSYNHHRDNKREVLSEDETQPESDDPKDTPEDLLHRMEAAGFLRLLLAELEEADRQLIQLKYYEDLKYREISERTGISIGTVGYRLHHVLKQLAEKLRHLGIESAP